MVLEKIGVPLRLHELPIPEPLPGQIRIQVIACALCRTDLHIIEGDLIPPHLSLILGHQIVGKVDSPSKRFHQGDLVGVPWLGKTCGHCFYCQHSLENLCDEAEFTGYTLNGGFAQHCIAEENFVFPIPSNYSAMEAAPLLCGGLIGYRAMKMIKEAKKIGFYGFGASASLLIQIATHQNKQVFAFTRKGDIKTQERAKKMGAIWAGDSETMPPEKLDAVILFAPIGSLIPVALSAIRKGGTVVCAEIHMSDIPSFPYKLLWGERVIRSIANLTRSDGEEFFKLAAQMKIKTESSLYPLEEVNRAISDLKEGKIQGTAILTLDSL